MAGEGYGNSSEESSAPAALIAWITSSGFAVSLEAGLTACVVTKLPMLETVSSSPLVSCFYVCLFIEKKIV